MPHPAEWSDYVVAEFVFADFPPGARVLDAGFGQGEQMRKLQALGCRAFGIEFDPALAIRGGAGGLAVCRARAEGLPFRTGSFDGLVCKVVIPYTDEAHAIAEIARVLRPGGVARVAYHGLGYFLKYLFAGPDWKRRVYGARVLVNTCVYRVRGHRLPGFWGDTILQSRARLRRYYRSVGLDLVEEPSSPAFSGSPVFIYHVLRRQGG